MTRNQNLSPSVRSIPQTQNILSAVAAGLSIALAQLLKLEHPIMRLLPRSALRIIPNPEAGVSLHDADVVGGDLRSELSQLLPASAWKVALGVLIAMLASKLLSARDATKVQDTFAASLCSITAPRPSCMPSTIG
jgi:hypothetical protein